MARQFMLPAAAIALGGFTAHWSSRPAHSPFVARAQAPAAQPVISDSEDTFTGVFHKLDTERAKLKLVQVVFRHGARTPLSKKESLWQNQEWSMCAPQQGVPLVVTNTRGEVDPVNEGNVKQMTTILPGGCHRGQLTLVGQAQALGLGRWLRARYVDGYGFLPGAYQPEALRCRTTNFSRTVGTLRGVLTGLYPDTQTPVPVTTSTDLDEILYADTKACPHLGSFNKQSRMSGKEAIFADPDYAWAKEALAAALGLDANDMAVPWVWTDVHDVMTSMATHGLKLPPAMDQRLLHVVDRLATKEFTAVIAPSVRDAHGKEVLRLSMGRLLYTLTGNMRRVVSEDVTSTSSPSASTATGSSSATSSSSSGSEEGGDSYSRPPHMYIYSGHDSTVMPLLVALGVDVEQWPPYLSNLIFELWELAPPSPPAQQPPQTEALRNHQSATQSTAPKPPRYVVRVLYNQEDLALPACPPGYHASLDTFVSEVVGPFLLSHQSFADACRVRVRHDGSMPEPQSSSADSESQQQQRQQQPAKAQKTAQPQAKL